MNIPEIDIRLLYVFTKIYQLGHVSKAAHELNLAQSAASIALGKLRSHFNDPLFVRVDQKMQATEMAQALYPKFIQAITSLKAVHDFKVEAFDPKASTQEFNLSMTDIGHAVLLPKLMAYLRIHAPKVRLNVRSINAGLKNHLIEEDLSLAIGFLPELGAGFYQQTLFKQHYIGLAAQNHPHLPPGPISLNDYVHARHIDIHPFDENGNLLDSELKQLGLQRHIALKIPNYLGLSTLLPDSDLLATVPKILADFLANQYALRTIELPFAYKQYAIKLNWHEKCHKNQDHQWFRSVCFDLFKT